MQNVRCNEVLRALPLMKTAPLSKQAYKNATTGESSVGKYQPGQLVSSGQVAKERQTEWKNLFCHFYIFYNPYNVMFKLHRNPLTFQRYHSGSLCRDHVCFYGWD